MFNFYFEDSLAKHRRDLSAFNVVNNSYFFIFFKYSDKTDDFVLVKLIYFTGKKISPRNNILRGQKINKVKRF